MPLFPREEAKVNPRYGTRPTPDPEPIQPRMGELFGAAFRTENTVGSFLTDDVRRNDADADFDPFASIEGYELHAKSFVRANDSADVEKIKKKIDREESDRKLIHDAGATGVMATLAAGALDPINLIPVGGAAVKTYKTGGSILKGAAHTARAGLVGASAAEVALHASQETRTKGESVGNVAGATLLSGVLGSAVGLIGSRQVGRIARQVEEDLVVAHPDNPDMAEPNSVTVGRSVGAAQVRDTTLEQEALANAWGVEKAAAAVKLNPKIRLATSPSVEARRFVQEIAETPFYYEKNDAGISNPVALESIIDLHNARIGNTVERQKEFFIQFKNRVKKEGGDRLSYLQFREEVGKAAIRNDEHPIPEVAAVAKEYRKNVLDPLKEAAVKVGILPEDVQVKTADSYLHRWWDKNIVRARRVELRNILHNGLRPIAQRELAKQERNLVDIRSDAELEKLRLQEEIDQKQKVIDDDLERNPKVSLAQLRKEYGGTKEGRQIIRDAEKAAKRESSVFIKDVKRLSNARNRGLKKEIRTLTKKMEDVDLRLAKLDNPLELSDDELSIIADEIIDKLLGYVDTRVPYDLPITERGPLKERTLNFIKDVDVEDFLVKDIEAVARKYVRTIAPDVAIKDWFGELDVTGEKGIITTKVGDDYKALIDKAKTEKEIEALGKRREADIRDLKALVNQIRGTYGVPENPDSIIVRTGRAIRELQYVSKLGGMTASAFPDVARPVMVHGFMRTIRDGVVPLIKNFKGLKMSAREVKQAGAAWDMVLDNRAMTIAEIENPYVSGTKFEKGLQAISNTFSRVSLMTQWNTALKQFTGVVTQARIIDGVDGIVAGAASKKDVRYLAQIGIDANMAKRISSQLSEYGQSVDGVRVANTDSWQDLQAQTVYRAALKKEIDRIIVTPGAGDLPLVLKGTEAGKMISQFRSFALASTNKTLISGLQEADAQTMAGWQLAIGMGMVSYAFKTWDRGAELSDDPRVWIQEGVDRSGLLGVLAEVNQISNKATRGVVSMQALAGAPPLTRYANVNALGALFGPTVGTVQDVFQLTGSSFTGEWSQSDSRAARRLIPYQNLVIARGIFDEMEDGINDSLGIEVKK